MTGALARCRFRIQSTPTASKPTAVNALVRPADPAQNSIARGRSGCCGVLGIGTARLSRPASKICACRCAVEGGLLTSDSTQTIGSAQTGGPWTSGFAAAAVLRRGARCRRSLNDANRACLRQGFSAVLHRPCSDNPQSGVRSAGARTFVEVSAPAGQRPPPKPPAGLAGAPYQRRRGHDAKLCPSRSVQSR